MSNNYYYEQDTEFVTGFAGSGKSTVLAKRANPLTLVLVPTHKAALVLQNKGIENVYTIHAVLKLVPSINENFRKKMKTRLKKVGTTDLSEITDVFIDEFSMIPLAIFDHLMSVLPEKAKVTIFGDPYQLPPVEGEPIDPWEPIEELNVQYRSKNLSGTNQFMAFMRAIRDDTKPPPFNPPITQNWEKLFDSNTDRILAFTNKRVIELNNKVSTSDSFNIDEVLTMNGIFVENILADFKPYIYPTCVEKGKLMEEGKLVKKANDTTQNIQRYNTQLGMYHQATIRLDDKEYLIYYDPDHYATEQRLKKDVEKYQKAVIEHHELGQDVNVPIWCKENRGKKFVMERGKAWSKYLAHTNYVFNLARPYATTVHKAQGSEFRAVFIDINNMKKAIQFGPNQYMRLMYVAISRAQEQVYYI